MNADGGHDGRVERRLSDLVQMAHVAQGIVAKGLGAYLADGIDGQTLRLAGRQLVVQVATVVEKLPDSFKDQHPDVEWVKIQRMRNLVAHHYDKVLDEFVWESLRTRIPDLVDQLGAGEAQ
ncbi:DUF86 domain-containing protein [Cellulomonas sp. KRMCY2]|uniref:HepT-like ribonuclease domain-containing protein n=1 Tax=Cellulomonas sp. KRMCY2 TaxID=1304865 RepID=UPI00045EB198|nr:HepT-like ribonuclease domain-containing protein [Cellulomonas sp. KRMCY2]